MPRIIEKITEANPTSSEIRAPKMMVEKNVAALVVGAEPESADRCLHPGRRQAGIQSWSMEARSNGLCGAIQLREHRCDRKNTTVRMADTITIGERQKLYQMSLSAAARMRQPALLRWICTVVSAICRPQPLVPAGAVDAQARIDDRHTECRRSG